MNKKTIATQPNTTQQTNSRDSEHKEIEEHPQANGHYFFFIHVLSVRSIENAFNY